jgi:hypothetical protein
MHIDGNEEAMPLPKERYKMHNGFPNEMILETTVDGRIIPVRDGEAMVFEFELGPFKVIAISNIPEEGKTTAPVYLKFKMNDGRTNGMYRKRFPKNDYNSRNQPNPNTTVDYVRGGSRDNVNSEDYQEET